MELLSKKISVIEQIIFRGSRRDPNTDEICTRVTKAFKAMRKTGFTPELFGALSGKVINVTSSLDVGQQRILTAKIKLDEESTHNFVPGVIFQFKAHLDRGVLRGVECRVPG